MLFMHWYHRVSAPPCSSRSTAPSNYPLTTQMHALALPGSQLRHARRSSSRCWSCVPISPPPAANLSRASVRTGAPLNPRFVGPHFTRLQLRVASRCAARNHMPHSSRRHAALRSWMTFSPLQPAHVLTHLALHHVVSVPPAAHEVLLAATLRLAILDAALASRLSLLAARCAACCCEFGVRCITAHDVWHCLACSAAC